MGSGQADLLAGLAETASAIAADRSGWQPAIGAVGVRLALRIKAMGAIDANTRPVISWAAPAFSCRIAGTTHFDDTMRWWITRHRVLEVFVPDRAVSRSRRAVVAAGLAVAGAHLLPGLPLGAEALRDRDCKDFRTQKQAQRFFKKNGGPRDDPHRLDADNDGKACEELR
jgi:hypothetical protein